MAEYLEKEGLKKSITSLLSIEKVAPNIKQLVIDIIDGEMLADVQPIDKDNMHIIYIGRKAYLAEDTIIEFMKKMDIIRDSLAHIENYFDTYAETIRQINACGGRCTDINEVKYFIDRIKENCGYD